MACTESIVKKKALHGKLRDDDSLRQPYGLTLPPKGMAAHTSAREAKYPVFTAQRLPPRGSWHAKRD